VTASVPQRVMFAQAAANPAIIPLLIAAAISAVWPR
jgi:hypothetical protein